MTTGDSLLGDGVAELVAEEMTGEGGPRAVHMGTALRAWRRAGGGLRVPLDRVAELRAARDLGAGLVVEGSIVGLGERLSLSAQVVSTPSGNARRVLPVAGLADSLPQLIERLTAGVLAASGTPLHAGVQRLSDSPAAVRAYMDGLAAFRRGRFDAAAEAFDRASALDSLFFRAWFMRWMTSTWGAGYGSAAAHIAAERAQAPRAHLSPDDQIVLDVAFGDLAGKERAATLAPESPEVLYFLGDYLYHRARLVGWTQALNRARVAFEQSAALDSQTTVLHHLVEIGLWTDDTLLLRTTWRAYDAWVQGADPSFGWLVARRLGDEGLLAVLRRRPLRGSGSCSSRAVGRSPVIVGACARCCGARRSASRIGPSRHAAVPRGVWRPSRVTQRRRSGPTATTSISTVSLTRCSPRNVTVCGPSCSASPRASCQTVA